MNKAVLPRTLEWFAWIVLACMVLHPLFLQETFSRMDGSLHFYRLVELDWHIQNGDWFPRWFNDVHFGFGGPVLNYYAPLSYYIPVLLHRLGLSLPSAFKAGFILAAACALLGMAAWVKVQFRSRSAALVAAAAYALSPYMYIATIQRCSLPEAWALAIAPWMGWALAGYPRRAKHSLIPFSLLLAALCLTHNISALLLIPVLLIYGFSTVNWSLLHIKRILMITILGLGMASFHWLPALVTSSDVQWHRALISDPRGLLIIQPDSPAHLSAYRVPPLYDPLHAVEPIHLLLLLLVLVLVGFTLVFNSPTARQKLPCQACLALGILFSLLSVWMLPLNRLVWQSIPLASLIQFPWRLLGPAFLLGAWLAGALIARWSYSSTLSLFSSLLIITFFLFSRPWSANPANASFPEHPTPLDVLRFESANPFFAGTTSSQEFLPRWVQQMPSALPPLETDYPLPDPLRLVGLPPGFTLLSQQPYITGTRLSYSSLEPALVTFHQFYFPGWVAILDGHPLAVDVSSPEGLILLHLPAGDHHLELVRTRTPVQVISIAISLISSLILLHWAFGKQGSRRPCRIPAPTDR